MSSDYALTRSIPVQGEDAAALDGESTALWACQAPGFFGSMRQLFNCARCGQGITGGPHTPRRYRDTLKPTMHVICDPCYDELPA